MDYSPFPQGTGLEGFRNSIQDLVLFFFDTFFIDIVDVQYSIGFRYTT